MNKKFKYKKSLLAAILSATLLAGCDGGGSGSSSDTPPVDSGTGSLPEVKPDPTPNPEPTPEPTPDPEPTPEPIPDPEPTPEPEPEPVPTKTGYLTLGGSQRVTGATCNGESSDGFTFKPGEDVTCVAGNTTIATFNTQSEAARSLRAVEKVSFSLEDAQELAGSDDKKSNAVSLVTSSNSCPANTEQVCLTFSSVIESKRFDSLYKQIDLAPEEFKKLVNEEVENNAATDKAPSTHTSPVVPVTTPGTKPDLNASFVSAKWKYQVENKPDDKPKLEVASWLEDVDGKQETRYAFIDEADHKTEDSLKAAKEKIFAAFPGLKECTNPAYHYEVNCLEYRPGTGVPVTGGMYVPQYTQLSLNADTAKAMVQAADLGTNIQRLYQHELYFRTNGRKGERLSSVDLERLYQNMSVWLWNDTSYRYEEGKNDELGFKTFTEFLNCYANDAYAGGTKCSADLKKSLVDNNMIYGDGSSKAGMMNPSYPLNYMEKPLTRLMLGRSWWDLNIKVDVEKYPGAVSEEGQNVTETISLYSNPTKWFAGNMQSTGLWAPAQKEVTIKSNANVPVTVTVALADDLTGREKHEVALNRPPRVTKTYSLDASGTVKFKVPYGGLIYIKGNSSTNESASFTFTGVVKAPFYKDGAWKNDLNSPAPLGELESDAFVYTTPKKNLNASNYTGGLEQFANDLDTFASSMNDFYGRDSEDGKHRMFTYKNLPGHKHRFTNDVQISIGDAHSGYPVMNSSFSPNSTTLPTTPLNDWLIWHEVGHNAAETPLTVPGATEVANNVLALYMQDRYLGKMNRVADDITVAPEYLEESNNQAWARGGAGDRLLMYAQLKEWAEKNFDIKKWYPDGTPLPEFYSEREGMKGWNLFQLMHRKARGDEVSNDKFGGKNYCAESNGNAADTLMLCASWVAQTDLSEFFKKWNPGANAYQLPGASEMSFEGGVSQSAYNTLASLDLPKPEQGPETINQVTEHKMSAE